MLGLRKLRLALLLLMVPVALGGGAGNGGAAAIASAADDGGTGPGPGANERVTLGLDEGELAPPSGAIGTRSFLYLSKRPFKRLPFASAGPDPGILSSTFCFSSGRAFRKAKFIEILPNLRLRSAARRAATRSVADLRSSLFDERPLPDEESLIDVPAERSSSAPQSEELLA